MRFVLLFLFLALVIVLLAVWAYRQVIRSVAAKRREIAELRRRPTPEERYRTGEIDVFELERLLEAERRQLETKRRGD